MSVFWNSLCAFFVRTAAYWGVWLAALALTLALVPAVRALCRRLGMVDLPGPRRINTAPIPRGGGLAIFLALVAVGAAWHFVRPGVPLVPGLGGAALVRFALVTALLAGVGFADDKFSLRPRVKLAGQVAVALLAHFACGVGFAGVFPGLPAPLDAALTVFWLVGAVNAFNLIDGLDGLATGLAAIALAGMFGALCCIGLPERGLFHLILLGACLGFLRYNFHPASVFLGDTGSMLLGFLVAVLPLATRAPRSSFLISVGVPLLAMGVPIFDTALAILRRTVRAALVRENPSAAAGNTRVMTADADHLHHRILRQFLSQRKAACALYALAALLVAIGVGGVALRERAMALYIVGFMAVAVIVFRDMRRIELWDAGRLLSELAHDRSPVLRRRVHLLRVPLLVAADVACLVAAWLLTVLLLRLPITDRTIHTWLVLRGVPMFLALVFFRAYTTVWSRAVLSNFIRLALAVTCGTAGSAVIVVVGGLAHTHFLVASCLYALTLFCGLLAVRRGRAVLRDLFYLIDSGRLLDAPETSRVVVYGAGLRYRAFRSELVRGAARNRRVVVGLLDDDLLLRGHYIGGIRIEGSLAEAPEILRRLRADAVVVACALTPERRDEARRVFAACGVAVTYFSFSETTL